MQIGAIYYVGEVEMKSMTETSRVNERVFWLSYTDHSFIIKIKKKQVGSIQDTQDFQKFVETNKEILKESKKIENDYQNNLELHFFDLDCKENYYLYSKDHCKRSTLSKISLKLANFSDLQYKKFLCKVLFQEYCFSHFSDYKQIVSSDEHSKLEICLMRKYSFKFVFANLNKNFTLNAFLSVSLPLVEKDPFEVQIFNAFIRLFSNCGIEFNFVSDKVNQRKMDLCFNRLKEEYQYTVRFSLYRYKQKECISASLMKNHEIK